MIDIFAQTYNYIIKDFIIRIQKILDIVNIAIIISFKLFHFIKKVKYLEGIQEWGRYVKV